MPHLSKPASFQSMLPHIGGAGVGGAGVGDGVVGAGVGGGIAWHDVVGRPEKKKLRVPGMPLLISIRMLKLEVSWKLRVTARLAWRSVRSSKFVGLSDPKPGVVDLKVAHSFSSLVASSVVEQV